MRPLPSTVLIVNPAAGRGHCGKRWPILAEKLKDAGIDCEAKLTRDRGDATRLTVEALRAGATTVVAVGGDGTANEVVNGFFEPGASEPVSINPQARFGLISEGTGADLARSLGIASEDATIAALAAGGITESIDVGLATFAGRNGTIQRRFFLNSADLGLGGETAAIVDAYPERAKALGGFIAYLLGAIGAIVSHRSAEVTVSVDDKPARALRADMIFVANGAFTGGGMRVAPGASLEDGLFDVLLLRASSKPTVLFRLLPAIYRGTHLRHPAVQHVLARHVRVETAARLAFEMDGEPLGFAPAEFVLLPGALSVVLPASLTG
jgi:YegS/Rv2252/BmrU family lipid kinase